MPGDEPVSKVAWRDGGDNAIGNGVVEQPEGQVHARMWRQRFSALPGAGYMGDAAIAGIAHTEPASTFGAQQQTLLETKTLARHRRVGRARVGGIREGDLALPLGIDCS